MDFSLFDRFKIILIVILAVFIANALYFMFINPLPIFRKQKTSVRKEEAKKGLDQEPPKQIGN